MRFKTLGCTVMGCKWHIRISIARCVPYLMVASSRFAAMDTKGWPWDTVLCRRHFYPWLSKRFSLASRLWRWQTRVISMVGSPNNLCITFTLKTLSPPDKVLYQIQFQAIICNVKTNHIWNVLTKHPLISVVILAYWGWLTPSTMIAI